MPKTLAHDSIIEGSIWKGMLRLFLPIMLGTLLQQLYNMADTVIVSRFVGKEALAAVGGSSAIIIFLLVNFFVALASGASVVIAQHYGAGRYELVRRGVQNALVLALASGALLTVVGVAAARPLLTLLRTTADTMEFSVDYLHFYFLGMIPSMIYNMGSGILRAMGDPKKPLLFLAVSMVLNIALDLLFVVVFEMAVIGAAVATTIAQTVSAVLVLITMLRLPENVRPDLRHPQVNGEVLRRMLQIGLPSGFQSAMYNIANMVVQTAVNSLGTDVVAGWSAYRKLDDIYWPISNAIGITVMTFVGQNYGARRPDRVKRSIATGLSIHLIVSVLFAAAACLARYPLIGLFAKGEPAVIQAGVTVTVYTCLFYPLFSCTEVFAATMRAVGNAIKPTIITLVFVCLLRIVYLWLYGLDHASLLSIAVVFPVTWAISSSVFLVYYNSSRWMPRLMRRQLAEDAVRHSLHHN